MGFRLLIDPSSASGSAALQKHKDISPLSAPPDGFPVVLGLFEQCEACDLSREKLPFCIVKTVLFCLYDDELTVVNVLAPFHIGPGKLVLELLTSVGADGLANRLESVLSRSVSGVLPK